MSKPIIRKPVIYLTNAELMAEINRSKATYCSFVDSEYAVYDMIISSKDEITPEIIQQLQIKKAERLDTKARKELRQTMTPYQVSKTYTPVDSASIDPAGLVFRVMTYEHIPLEEGRVKNPKIEADRYAKLIFPPFKHYIMRDGELVEVGRSHWVGGLANGWFNQDHGRMTNKLGAMLVKLVDRYGSKGNWRGYSYNDEMRATALTQLVQVGLAFNEARSSNPFAYYTVIAQNAFTKVLNQEKRNQNLRDDLMEISGDTPSMTRQLDNESKARGEVKVPVKMGRKPKS